MNRTPVHYHVRDKVPCILAGIDTGEGEVPGKELPETKKVLATQDQSRVTCKECRQWLKGGYSALRHKSERFK